MANLNRKERRAQRNESNTIGMLLRLFFGLSFIGLAVVLFGELDLNYVFSIFTADIIVFLNLRNTQQISHYYILGG